jgi:5'-3' exonuclease
MFSPDKCFFVLEGRPQFRYDLYSDYKANRIIKLASKQETVDKFLKTKDIVVALMQHLPITICRASNYEADDTVGSLCDNMKDESLSVITSDSDYIQLLQRGYKNIRVYNPIKKVDMVAPDYFFNAFKSLTGDKSDSIKRLVSDKKALSFCNDPALLKKFMEIEENRAAVSINKQLVEFADVPLNEIIFNEGIRSFNKLKSEFAKMKFETIINPTSWKKYVDTFDCLKY